MRRKIEKKNKKQAYIFYKSIIKIRLKRIVTLLRGRFICLFFISYFGVLLAFPLLELHVV